MPKLKVFSNSLSEKEIKNQILAWLWYNRIDSWVNESVGIWDEKQGAFRRKGKFFVHGRPDIEGILRPYGRWFGVEVKTPTGIVSPKQREFIQRIQNAGGLIFVARCLDDVVSVLDKYANAL